MHNNKKSLLMSIGLGIAILSWGEITLAQANQSTLTTGISATGRISGSVTTIGSDGVIRRGTNFRGETIGGTTIPIPQDVFRSISSGVSGDPNFNQAADIKNSSPDQIVICLSDSCSPKNNSDSISLKDLANLVENDLNQALNDLAIAEQGSSNSTVASDDSRQIVRRESAAQEHCGCAPGEITISRQPETNSTISQKTMTVTEASQIVETKLIESSAFVEKVNQIKPENSLW